MVTPKQQSAEHEQILREMLEQFCPVFEQRPHRFQACEVLFLRQIFSAHSQQSVLV